jgi:SAM-dependent methyltransferase
MRWLGAAHGRFVGERRVRVLARLVAPHLPQGATVLDVGCGDGQVASEIATLRPDVSIRGVDVMIRPETRIPVDLFDGERLPAGDQSVDVVVIVDVLHHTNDPATLIAESARVARKAVIIKDHLSDGLTASARLRFMDWVGNAPHGVRLPYNYWPRQRWHAAFTSSKLAVEEWTESLGLYGWPASVVFEHGLHFLTRLRNTRAGAR